MKDTIIINFFRQNCPKWYWVEDVGERHSLQFISTPVIREAKLRVIRVYVDYTYFNWVSKIIQYWWIFYICVTLNQSDAKLKDAILKQLQFCCWQFLMHLLVFMVLLWSFISKSWLLWWAAVTALVCFNDTWLKNSVSVFILPDLMLAVLNVNKTLHPTSNSDMWQVSWLWQT